MPLLGCALASAGFTVVRDPGSLAPIVWPTGQVAMLVQSDGSDDVTDGSDLQAIQDALTTWGLPTCSSFQFVFGGFDPSRVIADDGINRITFLEQNWPGGANGAGAFAVRYRDTAANPDTWDGGDIRINGEHFSWSTDGESPDSVDIQSVTTHELGHILGLFHSSVPEATMFFQFGRGLTHGRTLHADDIAGLCHLYPSAPFSCSVDADCPMFLGQFGGANTRTFCSGTTCVAGPSSEYGAECFSGADCAGRPCVSFQPAPPSSEPDLCSQACTLGGTDCPGNDLCSDLSGQPRCYFGRDDCIDDADCSGPNGVCRIDLDGRYRCLELCIEDGNCAGGEVCHWGTGANPPGRCRTPGPAGAGSSCQHGLQCQSLSCTAGGAQPTCANVVPGFVGDGGTPDGGASLDLGPPDGGAPDGGSLDLGPPDGGAPDGGAPDLGALDGGAPDGGAADLGALDGGAPVLDAGTDGDLGVVSDLGAATDAAPRDAPALDARRALDASPVEDLGSARIDSGPGTAGDPVDGGCSCETSPRSSNRSSARSTLLLGFVLLGVWVRRRRHFLFALLAFATGACSQTTTTFFDFSSLGELDYAVPILIDARGEIVGRLEKLISVGDEPTPIITQAADGVDRIRVFYGDYEDLDVGLSYELDDTRRSEIDVEPGELAADCAGVDYDRVSRSVHVPNEGRARVAEAPYATGGAFDPVEPTSPPAMSLRFSGSKAPLSDL